MPDTKVSALTAAGSLLSTQEFPVNEGGTSKKVTGAQIKAANTITGWRAYLNNNQSRTAGQRVSLDTTSFNPGSAWDVATNFRWTCPVTGFYHVSFRAECFVVAGIDFMAGVRLNGAQASFGNEGLSTATTYIVSNGADILSLSAGDHLELWIETLTSAQTVNAGAVKTFMSIHAI